MIPMTINHVREFINIYTKSNQENLLVWLNSFNFYDQMCLIHLITKYKFDRHKWEKVKPHTDCGCTTIYNSFSKKFKFKFTSIEMFTKCVPKKPPPTHEAPLEWIYSYNIEATTQPQTIKAYHQYIPSSNPFAKNMEVSENLFDQERDVVLSTFKMNNLAKDYNYYMPISYFKSYSLDTLLPFLDVLDLYTLFIIRYMFNMRSLESLIPEYWRSLNRKIYNKKKPSPLTILSRIYSFYSGETILDHNTTTKATFKLSRTVPLDKLDPSIEYIVQPRFSGLRLLICKTTSPVVIIRNINNVKIKLNFQLFNGSNLDVNHTFTGEFMMVLYNSISGQWLSKKELIDHLSNSSREPHLIIYLYVLDLFLWNSVTLTTISYFQRQDVIKKFVEQYQHNGLFRAPLPEYQVEELEQLYNKYLHEEDATAPPFTGVVYRKKHVNFTFDIPYTLFQAQKFIIYNNFSTKVIILRPNEEQIVEKNSHIIPILYNSKVVVTFLCFDVVDTILKLAIYKDYKYIHFASLQIEEITKCSNFNNINVIINAIEYRGFMLNVGFTSLFDKIDYILPRPDKSLIDCIDHETLCRLKINFYRPLMVYLYL